MKKRDINKRIKYFKAQSSLELLITLTFALIILLPIITIAFIQVSNSASALSTTEAEAAAEKLASIATAVGSQGYPAKQLTIIEIPQNVKAIDIGTLTNGLGHEITFIINTNSGPSYISAYTSVNISGSLKGVTSEGVYLVNVSAQNTCPSYPSQPCVYISLT
ncbi:MAG: hypothetical protein ACP5UN_01530 [Candidatus Micrarchaeia archaeon]